MSFCSGDLCEVSGSDVAALCDTNHRHPHHHRTRPDQQTRLYVAHVTLGNFSLNLPFFCHILSDYRSKLTGSKGANITMPLVSVEFSRGVRMSQRHVYYMRINGIPFTLMNYMNKFDSSEMKKQLIHYVIKKQIVSINYP